METWLDLGSTIEFNTFYADYLEMYLNSFYYPSIICYFTLLSLPNPNVWQQLTKKYKNSSREEYL